MSDSLPKPFHGLRVVLHECNRRAAVTRCLSSLRWLAMRGAEVVLVDGTFEAVSADRTAALVHHRFPFAKVLQLVGDVEPQDMRECLLAPLSLVSAPLSAPPRWVLQLSASLEVDRFRMQALLRELRAQPLGTGLVPSMVGPDGRTCLAPSEGRLGGTPRTWLARRRDLAGGTAGLRWATAKTPLLVSRPEGFAEPGEEGADYVGLSSAGQQEPHGARVHGGGLHHAEA